MLHFGDDHRIARSDDETRVNRMALPHLVCAVAERVRREVEALSGVLREDYVRGPRTHETSDRTAGIFVRICGLFSELVRTAVHGSVAGFVESTFGIENGRWLLAGCRTIEIDQRPITADRPRQDREILADPRHVQSGRHD